MAIDISCRFVGGPQGEERHTVPQFYCRDQLSLEIGWARPSADGGVEILKGQRPRDTEWLAATRAIYQKAAPISNGEAVYEFVRLDDVRRCEKILEGKGRRCRHEAAVGSDFCNTHQRKR